MVLEWKDTSRNPKKGDPIDFRGETWMIQKVEILNDGGDVDVWVRREKWWERFLDVWPFVIGFFWLIAVAIGFFK